MTRRSPDTRRATGPAEWTFFIREPRVRRLSGVGKRLPEPTPNSDPPSHGPHPPRLAKHPRRVFGSPRVSPNCGGSPWVQDGHRPRPCLVGRRQGSDRCDSACPSSPRCPRPRDLHPFPSLHNPSGGQSPGPMFQNGTPPLGPPPHRPPVSTLQVLLPPTPKGPRRDRYSPTPHVLASPVRDGTDP